ncbi:DUF3016 domain-containing protein [Xanthomonadaceae bacterium JHOS43]|nr:DUF3016 domain-containing protein [Xanthomonadaceae bacterium JHOS43]
MNRMYRGIFVMALATAWLPLAIAQDGIIDATSRVDVDVADIGQMREVKHQHGTRKLDTTRSIQALASWLQSEAERRLPADQRLHITLRDVDLAGEYEPTSSLMNDIRVIKDIYPPRIELDYRLTDAAGTVLSEGDATLRDIGFLQKSDTKINDPLRFEKRMLGNWLRGIAHTSDEHS